MRPFLLIAIICVFFSCHTNEHKIKSPSTRKTGSQIFVRDTLIDFKYFSFIAPKGWQSANDDTLPVSGDATVRRRFHNESEKLIYFEYGLSTFGERFSPYPIPAYRRVRYVEHNFDTSGWVFSDDPRLSMLMEQSTYDIYTLKVAGFPAFVYKPKAYGNGYSGVYIDSTGVEAGNLVEFAVYAENLDSLEFVQLRKIINTLEIGPFK